MDVLVQKVTGTSGLSSYCSQWLFVDGGAYYPQEMHFFFYKNTNIS